MAVSEYIGDIRARIGHRLLLIPGVAAVIRDERGRILLQRRADEDRWGLPAGAIDPGETPADAVVREVHEETGLVVAPVRVLGIFGGRAFRHRYPNGDEIEPTTIVFDCRVTGGALAARDGESAALRYLPPDELPALEAYPRELFDDGRARETLFAAPTRV